MLKSPVGVALGVVGLLLVLSPEARKTARKWAVKATESVLDLSDQAKDATAGIGSRVQAVSENLFKPSAKR